MIKFVGYAYFWKMLAVVYSIRLCQNNSTIGNVKVENVTYRYSFRTNESNENANLMLSIHVHWDIDKPKDFELDGIIINMQYHALAQDLPSIVPTNVCNTGSDFFWVKTNDTVCTNNTLKVCGMKGPSTNFHLCPYTFKSQGYPPGCNGAGNYFLHGNKAISVLPNIRDLDFEVEFHESYAIHIHPYFGDAVAIQFISANTLFSAVDCPVLVMEGTRKNFSEATEFCCDIGIRHHLARNVTIADITVDFQLDAINATIRWLPPITKTNFRRFMVFPHLKDFFRSATFLPSSQSYTNHTLGEDDLKKLASCDNTTLYYQTTITLHPGVTYDLIINTEYGLPQHKEFDCDSSRCSKITVMKTPEINACNKSYFYCDINANCTASDVTGKVTINATCTCHEGYEGNGINKSTVTLGTGCVDIDYCDTLISPCSVSAFCTDLIAPQLGANCTCDNGYYGDGFWNGTGCTSIATTAIAIALPTIVVIGIIIAAISWKIWRRRTRHRNLKWSKFVANDALNNYTISEKIAMNEGSDVCLPTFGEKWELNREFINIGEILGRGNYGVVYQASYSQYDEEQQLISSAPVAVKMVKEGTNEEQHVAEFLAEIGFMLNVGNHPNVLKVIGCCTTQKPVLLVTDFLKYGDLLHFLWDAREPSKCLDDPIYHITEKSLYQMARQTADGMAYLTSTRIIHGDLAARNILVGEDLICKISDFGLANDVYRYGVIQGQSERCVPFKWISPERMMAGKVPITSKSDVWSFGNLMYEMVTLGCMPHPGISSDELLDKLRAGYRMKQPSTCNNEMFSIMSKCWCWRPSSRPSFSNLVGLLDKALVRIKDVDYVNLAETVEDIDKFEYENEVRVQKEVAENYESKDGLGLNDLIMKNENYKNNPQLTISFNSEENEIQESMAE